jgi:hypothetical protein
MTSSSCRTSRAFDGSWTSWLKAVSLRGWGARRLVNTIPQRPCAIACGGRDAVETRTFECLSQPEA